MLLDDPPQGPQDNVTDWMLERVHRAYDDTSITKDDVWHYLYGVMHAPDWRARYKNDLRRSLPRVPLATDFEAFRAAGEELMWLHANYEHCPEHQGVTLEVSTVDDAAEQGLFWKELTDDEANERSQTDGDTTFRIDGLMRWNRVRHSETDKVVDDKSQLWVNQRCRLSEIPPQAQDYTVSGRSPLDWAIASLRWKEDKPSGIVDDPNGWVAWADEPFELIRHLRRLVYLSVRSAEIIAVLPSSLDGPVGPGRPVSRVGG